MTHSYPTRRSYDLQASGEHVVLQVRGPPLGLGGVDVGELSGVEGQDRLVDIHPCNVDQCLHLGELELGVLEVRNQLSERATVLGVGDRLGQHCLGNGNRVSSDREPLERSEEHTSELQSLMRISYAVFCLK